MYKSSLEAEIKDLEGQLKMTEKRKDKINKKLASIQAIKTKYPNAKLGYKSIFIDGAGKNACFKIDYNGEICFFTNDKFNEYKIYYESEIKLFSVERVYNTPGKGYYNCDYKITIYNIEPKLEKYSNKESLLAKIEKNLLKIVAGKQKTYMKNLTLDEKSHNYEKYKKLLMLK